MWIKYSLVYKTKKLIKTSTKTRKKQAEEVIPISWEKIFLCEDQLYDEQLLLLLKFAFITYFLYDKRVKKKETVSWEPKLSMSTHRICMPQII